MCYIEQCPFEEVCKTVEAGGKSAQGKPGFLENLQIIVKRRDAAIMGLACMEAYEEKCGLSSWHPNSWEPTQIVLEDLSRMIMGDMSFWKEVEEYASQLKANK